MTTPLEQLVGWASTLTLADVPPRVVELAKTQVLSHFAAIRAGLRHAHGNTLTRAFGDPLQPDVERSAALLAALGSWLHFDDTAYAGHLSNSTVAVPLAYAYARGLDGTALLTSVIAANECAARVTAATTLGPFRGQMAAHTNLAGAISGRLRCENAPADRWVDAFGLAFAAPTWTIMHGYMGSDARLLSASVSVRSALHACDAAAAGLRGAPDIFEHPGGFLARFATVPLPGTIAAGLGRRWHTDSLSFKVHPSGPGTDAAVDCAREIHRRWGPVDADAVREIEVHTSLYTVLVNRTAAAYVDGPGTTATALASTTAYPVATALMTGNLTPADLAQPAVMAADRWALADKVRVIHDEEMTTALLVGEAPFGEAIREAGERGVGWLRDFGGPLLANLLHHVEPPSETFEFARKLTPARVEVHMLDGTVREHRVDIPVGGAGAESEASCWDLVREKFRSTGGSDRVADGVSLLDELPPAQTRELIRSALEVRRLSAVPV